MKAKQKCLRKVIETVDLKEKLLGEYGGQGKKRLVMAIN